MEEQLRLLARTRRRGPEPAGDDAVHGPGFTPALKVAEGARPLEETPQLPGWDPQAWAGTGW
ncbi:hypothetical protein [Streptomyces doebereineriae]|uniref:Uncharacterized protein n=1 Tax=Streptomyces doebereineriae TaxID=3075528 RepID=A0ABU2VAN1_9ACTN|nr:hypothetical protein [Streptomyces sp. DSM 41640]MDT0482413.1 hypothetical protein [Streptomyces sp. DSM 41640]